MRLVDIDTMKMQCSVKLTNADAITLQTALQSMFDNAPTVDAEPVRHGHWKEDDTCSCCHSEMLLWVGYMGKIRGCRSNYCPNCGAKMDLEVSQ